MSLWDHAAWVYARPGVSAACLAVQDDHGQCVSLLLWRAWAVAERRPAGVVEAAAISEARVWENEITGPLRAVRRARAADAPLRAAVLAAELAAERQLLATLEALTPPPDGVAQDLRGALASLALAWRPTTSPAAVDALATALSRV